MTVPATLNLEETQGDDWSITCNFIDASGYAIDLSASTFTAQIRKRGSRNSSLVTSFSIDTSDADVGVLVLSLTAEQTALLTQKHYYYDLQQDDYYGYRLTVLAGKITLTREVTS